MAAVAAPAPAAAADCPSSSSRAGVAAEQEGELFDVLDENGAPLGFTELRSVVHARGLYHRAVYVWVLNAAGELLLQRRSLAKKVGPGQWDLSVAEHLQPGEPYADAALRGLQEELGITAGRDALHGPLAPAHLRKLLLPDKGIMDFEFVESFKLQGYEGPLSVNTEEVIDVRFVALDRLREEMQREPDSFSVWLREELQLVQGQLG